MNKLHAGALVVAIALVGCSRGPLAPSGPPDGLVRLQTSEKAALGSVQISPDGRWVLANAALTSRPTYVVFDAWTGKEAWRIEAQTVLRVHMSPSGRRLVVHRADINTWTLAIHDVATGEKLLALDGDPAAWRIDEFAFSRDDAWLAVKTADMDVALYPIGAAQQPSDTVTAQPVVVRRSTRGYNPIGGRYAHLRFGGSDDELVVLWPDSHLLERYAVGPQLRLLESIDQTRSMLLPHGLSDDGAYGFSCGFTDVVWGRVDATDDAQLTRMRLDVEMPTGGYSFNPGSDCDASADRRWIAIAVDEASGALEFGYDVGIFSTDGKLVARDDGAEPGSAAKPVAAHAKALRFAPDSGKLYVVDAKLGLHVYKLGRDVKKAYVKPEELGFSGKSAHQALIAAANSAVAVLDLGADTVVWVPAVGDTVAYEKR